MASPGVFPHAARIIASSVVFGDLGRLPESMRASTYFTYPYRLPQDSRKTMLAISTLLKTRDIPETNPQISSKMYFLGTLLTDTFMHMQRNYYRDHFLDVIDMLQDQTYTIAAYPRLSFGPGQRYASKGCYIVQLSAGDNPDIVPKSDWVIH